MKRVDVVRYLGLLCMRLRPSPYISVHRGVTLGLEQGELGANYYYLGNSNCGHGGFTGRVVDATVIRYGGNRRGELLGFHKHPA